MVKLVTYLKNRNWLRYLIFLTIIICAFKYFMNNAEHVPEAKLWLVQQPEIISKVGNNIDVDIRKLTKYSGTSTRSSHHEFIFRVKGDLGSAKVRLLYIHDQNIFKIKAIR